MKNLAYIAFFICISVNAQKVTQVKYFNLLDSDSTFISQHSSWRGAYNKANTIKPVSDKDTFYIKGSIDRLIIDHRKEQIPVVIPDIKFVGISTTNITSTSVMILTELNTQIFDYAYIKFKRDIDSKWLETTKGKDSIFNPNNLVPKSNYIFKVIASEGGKEITSINQYFITK